MTSIAPDETSQVITHAYNLPIVEEAEHIGGIDLYHFAVTNGTKIQLAITSSTGTQEIWYTVSHHTVLAVVVSPLHMSIVRSSESSRLASQINCPGSICHLSDR